MVIVDNLRNFISSYRSLSQSADIFEKFTDYMELTLDKLSINYTLLIVVLGNVNAQETRINVTKRHKKKLQEMFQPHTQRENQQLTNQLSF